MKVRDPLQIKITSARHQAQAAISRIDAYLLRYLKDPAKDRLEYLTFLLKSYLDQSSSYALDKIIIAYEQEPASPAFSPLFPKEQRDADFVELEEKYSALVERHRATFGELMELKGKPKKQRGIGDQVPVIWQRNLNEEDTPSHLVGTKSREKLPIQKLTYNGCELPYVVADGQIWFVAVPALKALGIGEHWIKRTHIGAFNKRRDLNLEGIKRPSLLNFEGFKRVAKHAGRNNPAISINRLDVVVANVMG